jgi:hypothetical protein
MIVAKINAFLCRVSGTASWFALTAIDELVLLPFDRREQLLRYLPTVFTGSFTLKPVPDTTSATDD